MNASPCGYSKISPKRYHIRRLYLISVINYLFKPLNFKIIYLTQHPHTGWLCWFKDSSFIFWNHNLLEIHCISLTCNVVQGAKITNRNLMQPNQFFDDIKWTAEYVVIYDHPTLAGFHDFWKIDSDRAHPVKA